jgi:hypothetical protein
VKTVMQPQAKGYLEPPKAGRGRKEPSPTNPLISDAWDQNCETLNFCGYLSRDISLYKGRMYPCAPSCGFRMSFQESRRLPLAILRVPQEDDGGSRGR